MARKNFLEREKAPLIDWTKPIVDDQGAPAEYLGIKEGPLYGDVPYKIRSVNRPVVGEYMTCDEKGFRWSPYGGYHQICRNA